MTNDQDPARTDRDRRAFRNLVAGQQVGPVGAGRHLDGLFVTRSS